MIRTVSPWLALTVLAILFPAARGWCQAPKSDTTSPYAMPDPLPGLPHPPDIPGSLSQPAGKTPTYTCEPLAGPYFQSDPLLDPPFQPPVGWFADAEFGLVGAHVKNKLVDSVTVGARPADTVHLPGAELDWTVSPRFEAGYRLRSGFGAFALAYRFLVTDGSTTIAGPDGPAALRSRLDVNVLDLDYVSRELFTEQWPYVHMVWRIGLRYTDVFFDSHAEEAFAAAAAGSGIFETTVGNNFYGFGPHAGVELTRAWSDTGFSVMSRLDWALPIGITHQNFAETSTTLNSAGAPLSATTRETNPQTVPVVDLFLGLTWEPTSRPNLSVSLGYTFEYWWNVGRLSTTASRAEMSDQGILLRAACRY
jgi:hypothetical protein